MATPGEEALAQLGHDEGLLFLQLQNLNAKVRAYEDALAAYNNYLPAYGYARKTYLDARDALNTNIRNASAARNDLTVAAVLRDQLYPPAVAAKRRMDTVAATMVTLIAAVDVAEAAATAAHADYETQLAATKVSQENLITVDGTLVPAAVEPDYTADVDPPPDYQTREDQYADGLHI